MYTVLVPSGVNPIVVNKYINIKIISFRVSEVNDVFFVTYHNALSWQTKTKKKIPHVYWIVQFRKERTFQVQKNYSIDRDIVSSNNTGWRVLYSWFLRFLRKYEIQIFWFYIVTN